MKDVIIYTTKTCPYCYKAKSLLKGLDITYQEVSVDFNSELRAEMASRAGKLLFHKYGLVKIILEGVTICMICMHLAIYSML